MKDSPKSTRPAVRIPSTVRPNVRGPEPHDECWRQDHPARDQYGFLRLGDVRRCRHGKVQILTETDPRSRTQGPGTHWWRDLSPFWNRKTYRLAVEALRAAEDF